MLAMGSRLMKDTETVQTERNFVTTEDYYIAAFKKLKQENKNTWNWGGSNFWHDLAFVPKNALICLYNFSTRIAYRYFPIPTF